MSHRLILMLACAVLGGCAGLHPDLPVCDGTARRPANPHGSILMSPPAPASPAPPTGSPAAPTSPGAVTGGCA